MENKQWIYVKRPETVLSDDCYKLVESAIPQVANDEILIKAKYISVDPYMRIQQSATDSWEKPHPLNTVQGGNAIGEIIKMGSDNLLDMFGNTLQPGDLVNCYTGWQMYGTIQANQVRKLVSQFYENLSPSFGFGVLGMPGLTAFFGILEAGKPKAGETVVVSGAAGAVGSIVVQIAKIKGCKVIAFAGSENKLSYLRNLGVDFAYNYKDYKTIAEIRELLKDGVDIYFDNVGGMITDAIMDVINIRARIVICGQISQYNGGLDNPEMGPRFLHKIFYKRATIQGILARDYYPRYPEMLKQMSEWIREGKLKYQESHVKGFENLPKALNSLFTGENSGKIVVDV